MEIKKEMYEKIAHLFPKQKSPPKISNLEVPNAILKVLENGSKWRSLGKKRYFLMDKAKVLILNPSFHLNLIEKLLGILTKFCINRATKLNVFFEKLSVSGVFLLAMTNLILFSFSSFTSLLFLIPCFVLTGPSKRKQIKKQKKKSWKENETNNKFYEQSEQGNDEEDDSYVQQYKY